MSHPHTETLNDRRVELITLVSLYDSAEAEGRLDRLDGKPFNPPKWESGLPYSEQHERVDEYRRGYEAEMKRSRA